MRSWRRHLSAAAATSLVVAPMVGCTKDSGPPAPQQTVFGSNVWQAPGESRREALERIDATYGPIQVARIFAPSLPPSWRQIERDIADRPVVVSFKIPPDQVLSGAVDAQLRAWFEAAPTDRSVHWVYFHEPEDDSEAGAFTPREFADAWAHVARLAAAASHAHLKATLILMCWTVNPSSGRDWRDYVPAASGLVDVLAWDCYAKGSDAGSYADVEELLDPAHSASNALGASWAIGELGARIETAGDGQGRADWLTEVGAYATEHGAEFVTYFDAPRGGGFQLLDEPSIEAWAALVRS